AIAAWNGSTWSALGSGLRTDYYGTPAEVRNLAVFDGKLIASGFFTNAGGAPVTNIAAWDGTAWSALEPGFLYADVDALTVFDGKLIAGGGFSRAGGQSGIAAWDGVSWTGLGSGVARTGGAVVLALAVVDGRLIAAGQFTSAGGVPAN